MSVQVTAAVDAAPVIVGWPIVAAIAIATGSIAIERESVGASIDVAALSSFGAIVIFEPAAKVIVGESIDVRLVNSLSDMYLLLLVNVGESIEDATVNAATVICLSAFVSVGESIVDSMLSSASESM